MQFTIESWNHPCFNKYYHMVWGPWPLHMKAEIEATLLKTFKSNGVKHILYTHPTIYTAGK